MAATDRVAVLLTGVGKRYDIVSAFAQHALVVAVDPNPLAPAQYAADHRHPVPRIDDPGYVPALQELCERYGVRAVVPLTDLDLEVLGQARAAGQLPAFVPDPEIARATFDKYEAHLLFERLGLPSPPTVLPGEAVETYPVMEALRVSAREVPLDAAAGERGPSSVLFRSTRGDHAVALLCPRAATCGEDGARHIPRHEDDGGAERDEPGQQARTDQQLDERDRERGHSRRGERRDDCRPATPGEVGQPHGIGGQAEQDDVEERPREPERVREVVVADVGCVVLAQPQNDAHGSEVQQEPRRPTHRYPARSPSSGARKRPV